MTHILIHWRNLMENMIIRKANINDLYEIQKLNKELFELESKNFDSTLIADWPITQEGKEYFEKAIRNDSMFKDLLLQNT